MSVDELIAYCEDLKKKRDEAAKLALEQRQNDERQQMLKAQAQGYGGQFPQQGYGQVKYTN